MGFPLVTVQSFNTTHAKLNQARYRTNPNAKDPKRYRNPKYGFKWDIPIWYQEGNEDVRLTWLKRDEPLYLKLTQPDQPIVINIERNGFYRQNHDSQGWQRIADQLKTNHEVYSTRTRNAIISDAFAAALVNKVPYKTVFDLLQYLTVEKDYLPWAEALNGFFTVLDFFGNEPEIIYARVAVHAQIAGTDL
ncbi:unnamed protein product [Strongylus vulgaris]|uniref:ERAP1-like C-terminal domain-containing protein n=1 Tax=Strongylus vulgaris TaxID=40348 RepID=A0A3P7JD73_STRVU|nr:unnamed protein product [Strongylus vulgaris]